MSNELQNQIQNTKEHIQQLEQMLENARKQLSMLEARANSQPVQIIKNEITKMKVIVSVQLKSGENERWVECSVDDYEKDIELLKEFENLSDEMAEQLKTFIVEFKKKNNLQ